MRIPRLLNGQILIQKLFLRIFEKWQNSILSRYSAITSASKYTTHYTFKC